MGRLKYIHLVLLLGASLFISLFIPYPVYVDVSETLPSSEISFENPENEDLSICQRKFTVSYRWSLLTRFLGLAFGTRSSLVSCPLTPDTQITPFLRC